MELITPQGQRNSLSGGVISSRFGVAKRDLKTMVDQYLLRADPRLNSLYYELSHDSLVSPLLKRRQTRRIMRFGGLVVPACVLTVVVWQSWLRSASASFLLQNYVALAGSNTIAARIRAPIARFIVPQIFPDSDLSEKLIQKVDLSDHTFDTLNMGNATVDNSAFAKATINSLLLER